MADDEPIPDLFVARDRARRFARYIREALQERRLHYRGAEVGMSSLLDEADEALQAVMEDIATTVADILAGRIRDRERGFTEVPLVVAAEGIAERVDLARRLDKARTAGSLSKRDAGAAVIALLDDALLRIDAFCGAYDEKRPIGPARQTDLAHALAQVERQAHWERLLRDPHTPVGPPTDSMPPDVTSEPNGLEDVLRAARACLPLLPGPWRVEHAGVDTPLRLSLGEPSPDATEIPPPERLARALEVLAFVRPVAVTCLGVAAPASGGLLSETDGPGDAVEAITLALADEGAGRLETSMTAAAGTESALAPEHEKVVRALLSAPPLPADGPPPTARLVALMGVLKALDETLRTRILPRAQRNTARVAARSLPRENTRKAPLVRNVSAVLGARYAALPIHRLEDVAAATAAGKLAARNMTAGDVAVLIALLGRGWNAGGRDIPDALRLAPLGEAEIDALIRELCALGAVRVDLEAGHDVSAARITSLEQAALAILGRLGQVPALETP